MRLNHPQQRQKNVLACLHVTEKNFITSFEPMPIAQGRDGIILEGYTPKIKNTDFTPPAVNDASRLPQQGGIRHVIRGSRSFFAPSLISLGLCDEV